MYSRKFSVNLLTTVPL